MFSYIRAQNLYVQNLATGQEIQLTKDGGGTIKKWYGRICCTRRNEPNDRLLVEWR